MAVAIYKIAGFADQFRVTFLRSTLSNSRIRSIFRNREERVFCMFIALSILYLPIALFAPLFLLFIGPIIYGIPHLFASIRYVPNTIDLSCEKNKKVTFKKYLTFITGIFISVGIFRVISDVVSPNSIINSYFYLPEFFSLLVTFVGTIFIFKKNFSESIRAFSVLVVFLIAAWMMPLWTTGALIILHNFIAFIYWIASASNKRERVMAILALLIFTALNILVMLGTFDFLYKHITPLGQLVFADMNYAVLGKLIAPWSTDYHTWFHLTVIYAFGQALHYFVWMKAIPDYHHDNKVPTSFRQSYKLLYKRLGSSYSNIMLLFIVLFWGLWLFVQVPQARVLYFAIASYHGYMEIAGLGFLKFSKTIDVK
jgi:hypothetical protein